MRIEQAGIPWLSRGWVDPPRPRSRMIGPNGVEASYVNCALPGYRFPFPVGNGQPNDCGESWVSSEGQVYVYQDDTAGDLGKPMFPAVLP